MYKEHDTFSQPANENEKVWRYMDFTKFVSLIELGSLYFTRADEFEDPFEGSYPKKNIEERQLIPDAVPDECRDAVREAVAQIGISNRHWLRYVAVNCWHLNPHESAAMWKLYLKSNEGIAIQSTYQKLRDSFSKVKEDVFVGQVMYIDYDTEWFAPDNLLAPFVHKRRSFEHEREVRAVVMRWPIRHDRTGLDYSLEAIMHGLSIPVDLSNLIDCVYVAPDTPPCFADLVRSVIKHYGYSFTAVQSDLNRTPLY
jgi:hypothetical protein